MECSGHTKGSDGDSNIKIFEQAYTDKDERKEPKITPHCIEFLYLFYSHRSISRLTTHYL